MRTEPRKSNALRSYAFPASDCAALNLSAGPIEGNSPEETPLNGHWWPSLTARGAYHQAVIDAATQTLVPAIKSSLTISVGALSLT